MYMVLAVGLDVLFIRTNHVTYVIGMLCSCIFEKFLVHLKDFVVWYAYL